MTRFSVSDRMFSSLVLETRQLAGLFDELSCAAQSIWALHCNCDSKEKQLEANKDLEYVIECADASRELMMINEELRALKKRVRKLRKLARGTFIATSPVEGR